MFLFQRVHNKRVSEQIFFRMVQYFAVVLFECNEADDFSPAKSLMNMCFTFYHESKYVLTNIGGFIWGVQPSHPLPLCWKMYQNDLFNHFREAIPFLDCNNP